MTAESMPLSEFSQKAGGSDFRRAIAESEFQILMETAATSGGNRR